MKSSIGEITFEHQTVDDKLVNVTATVYFDRFGESSLDIVELYDEDGNEIEWNSLDLKDRSEIEYRASNNVEPQDEVFDEYEDFNE